MPEPAPNPQPETAPNPTARSALHLLRFAFAVSPSAFLLTVAVSLLGSLAEGAGLVLLLPLLSAAGMGFSGSGPASRLGADSQTLLTRLDVPHALWLPVVLGVFLLTAAARSLLRRSQYMLAYTTTTAVELALSRRVYEAVVKAQWGYLVRQRSGAFTHLLTQELRNVQDAVSLALSLINLLCMTALYLALALQLSAPMTLLVLAMGAVLLLLQRTSLARTRDTGKALSESVGEVYAATEEHLLNLKSVKTYDAEDRDVQMFAALCAEVARNSVRSARHQAAAAFTFELGSLLALGSILFLALAVLHVQAPTMLLLLAIFTRLMPQLASLQSQAHQAAGILPSFEHVLAIEAACRAHAEPKSLAQSAAPRLALARELRLEDLWFAYAPATPNAPPEYVLKGLTLPIEAGLITAVTGPSGAGKSTIADIANGLLTPTRGRILLDGVPLGPAELRQWHRQVGYVGQETVLFHQSVRANLLWAAPEASGADLRAALAQASATFVYDLPGGLDSIVGDRGILLSSGQRQRIALARALLRNPTLLILDEATNALDLDNEARILDTLRDSLTAAIESRNGNLTILLIAHRASAIQRAHRIFSLDSGVVVSKRGS
jgi:ATP-binding cassette subfamily C protein